MVAIACHSLPSISSHLHPSKPQKLRRDPPPIFISTNPSHVNLHQLVHLFASANLSCDRFPCPDAETGRVKPVDLLKLRTAVDHSSVVVSVFCREEFCARDNEKEVSGLGGLLLGRAIPVSERNGQLVGFGRAVSDGGLTAAIYDVAWLPGYSIAAGTGNWLQDSKTNHKKHTARAIMENIGNLISAALAYAWSVPSRVLTSRGIYDISALCSPKERPFFEACGFGGDVLGSTTMMYTRCASKCFEGDPSIRRAGRMSLLVPASQDYFSSEMKASS